MSFAKIAKIGVFLVGVLAAGIVVGTFGAKIAHRFADTTLHATKTHAGLLIGSYLG